MKLYDCPAGDGQVTHADAVLRGNGHETAGWHRPCWRAHVGALEVVAGWPAVPEQRSVVRERISA